MLSTGGGGGSQAKQSRTVCFCLVSLAGERQLNSCAFYPRDSCLLDGSTLREFQPSGTSLQAWKGEIGGPQAWIWWKLERFYVVTDKEKSQSKAQPCPQHQLFTDTVQTAGLNLPSQCLQCCGVLLQVLCKFSLHKNPFGRAKLFWMSQSSVHTNQGTGLFCHKLSV